MLKGFQSESQTLRAVYFHSKMQDERLIREGFNPILLVSKATDVQTMRLVDYLWSILLRLGFMHTVSFHQYQDIGNKAMCSTFHLVQRV